MSSYLFLFVTLRPVNNLFQILCVLSHNYNGANGQIFAFLWASIHSNISLI
uniref:Uncharacterized protein n=1 Tax=Siphoviridae sp. ct7aK2 TaxID=2825351 RepID=A0A8S5U9C3_9CAUD|nr:MAG TPA: hypothetical protein [Siphoviridae sp. ct7aK2]